MSHYFGVNTSTVKHNRTVKTTRGKEKENSQKNYQSPEYHLQAEKSPRKLNNHDSSGISGDFVQSVRGSRSREMMDALGARKGTKRKKKVPTFVFIHGMDPWWAHPEVLPTFLFVSDAEGNKQG